MPRNITQPRGLGFIMSVKVDAGRASGTVTRRSMTGFLARLKFSLVYWYSRKQNSVEYSSSGPEFIAMNQCCEYLCGIRYKLRMMGIPCVGPAYILGENQYVLANTSIPDSKIKKNNQSISYHFIREEAARDEWMTLYVNTHNIEADLLTKLLTSGYKKKVFLRSLMHHIFG